MSRIHFLADHSKNDLFEDINSTKNFSRDSISHSRHGWQYLVQRILKNEFSNELQILQLKLDSNIFQQYRLQLTNEYKIKENERVYKVHILPLLCVPGQGAIKSILVRVGSILHYSTITIHMDHSMMTPSVVRLGIVMKWSAIEDQSERGQNKSSTQNRVTIIPTSDSIINTSDKQASLIDDDSFVITSPKWRHSIDEQYFSAPNSHAQISFPINQRSSDNLRQMTIQATHRDSYQDEPLSSLHNLFFHKHHRNSIGEKFHDHNLPRLSLRSISYGFGLEDKTRTRKRIQQDTIISSSNYRLPANKIELDINQQEIIRHSGSLKRKM